MKVVFLSHMFPNESSPNKVPFMVERAKALACLVQLSVIAPVSYFPLIKKSRLSFLETIKGIFVYHPPYLALPSCCWSFRWIPYFFSLLINKNKLDLFSCDILHMEWIYPDAYGIARVARKKGIKTVAVVHGNEAIEYYGPRSHRRKYIEAFDALDKIIVVSDELKRKLISEYQVPWEKLSVIFNGVDVQKFSVIDKKYAREQLDLPLTSSVGVCVARLSEEKNLDILIQSVARLPERVPKIYIIGEGPLRCSLQDLIDRYGVGEWVKLVGPIPHEKISLWLGACDFFCLPSQREGCPVVIHEALACGRPVISTTVGAIPDLICQEDYGLLCPPSDVEALANLLEKAVSRTWDNEKIFAYGRQFTWEKVAGQTIKVFHEALS